MWKVKDAIKHLQCLDPEEKISFILTTEEDIKNEFEYQEIPFTKEEISEFLESLDDALQDYTIMDNILNTIREAKRL